MLPIEPDIVTVGGPSLDEVEIDGVKHHVLGGASFITALAARATGVSAGLVARVPRQLPNALSEAFGGHGLDAGGLVPCDGALASFKIVYDAEGRATYRSAATDPGGEHDLSADDLPRSWLQAQIIHISPLGGNAARQLAVAEAIRARGFRGRLSVGTFLCCTAAEKEAIRTLQQLADLFFCNREEAGDLFGPGAPPSSGATVIITDGPKELVVWDGGQSVHHRVPPADVVDPTGAGDALCGGYLAGLVSGSDPVASGLKQAAQALSSFGCEAFLEPLRTQPSPATEAFQIHAATGAVRPDPEQIGRIAAALRDVARASTLEFCGFPFPDHGDPLALEALCQATAHQFSFWYDDDNGYTEPMFAEAGGKRFKGSDFIWQAFTRAAADDPSVFDPHRMAQDPLLIDRICTDDQGRCPLPEIGAYRQIHQAMGRALIERRLPGFAPLVDKSNATASPGRAFLQALTEIPGYGEDPLAKKANLLLVILANRPEHFIDLRDPESVAPIVDYHVMRGALRTGCVRIDDVALASSLAQRSWIDPTQEHAIRLATLESVRMLVRLSGLSIAAIDGFLFSNGRRTCHETRAPDCDTCLIGDVCARNTGLFQPIIRTTAY